MGDHAPTPPPWSVTEVIRTVRLPVYIFGDLSDRFQVTNAEGETLSTELRKGGGIHAFLGRLTVEADPSPGLAHLTLLAVKQD